MIFNKDKCKTCKYHGFLGSSYNALKTTDIDPVDRAYMIPRDFGWIKRRMVEDFAEMLINDGFVEFNQINSESGAIELECTLRVIKN